MSLHEIVNVVAAIEFGPVSSMVGFNYVNEPWKVVMSWKNDDSVREDVPNSILLKPDGKTIQSFGDDAERQYIELVSNEQNKNYYFFKGLKGVEAVEDEPDHQITMKDESGKYMSAVNVLSLMIQYLVTEAINAMDKECRSDMRWVIVVPSCSSPCFIKIMKDSAKKAGIDEKSFVVITSTDSAALLFNNLPDDTISTKPHFRLQPGMQFITMIAGEDTVDTVVHHLETDGKIKEIGTLKRCNWGINMIIKELENLLTSITGKNVLELFKMREREDWMELVRTFQHKVMSESLGRDWDHLVTFSFPISFGHLLRELTGKTMKEAIESSRYKDQVTCRRDKMRIAFGVFRSLFDTTLKQIISHIKSVIQGLKIEPVALFMVGRFVDIPVFQNAIKEAFTDMAVVYPESASIAVLKGAFNAAFTEGIVKLFKGPRSPLVVASIDFGTTYSGWARSYQHDFKKDRTSAFARLWNSGSAITEKTPTCVLIGKDGKTAEKFGYDAISRYEELVQNGEESSYYYFRLFKMALHKKLGEKLDRTISIEDIAGRPLLALDVFAASIRFLKNDFLENSKNKLLGSLDDDEVQWMLTVPAIWSDGAKQFMREAAIKAGIKSRRLALALEPEAASIYCRNLPVEVQGDEKEPSVSQFQTGTKYMILDAGGGTVDITVHEVIDRKHVKEIHAASGGGWGGSTVNNAFEEIIKDLTGEDVYMEFCREYSDEHLEFLNVFEIKKRIVSPNEDKVIQMDLPLSLMNKYKDKTGNTLVSGITRSKHASQIKLIRYNKITFSVDLSRSFFKSSIDSIICHVRSLLVETNVSAILMVGGYSDSPMLQGAVKTSFPHIKTVIPQEAVTAIMKGALIFGHQPRQITNRVLKFTYGIECNSPFRKGIHPESKRFRSDDKEDLCKQIFDKHVEKDQSVNVGEPQTEMSYSPVNKSQTQMGFPIYASELKDPKYTDNHCTYVGKLTVDLSNHDGDLNRSVKVSLTFSDTEIVVAAKDEKTGEESNVAIDFLG